MRKQGAPGIDFFRRPGRIQVLERILEQAQLIFRLQDPAAGLVDISLGHTAFGQGFLERTHITVGVHVHVQSGLEGSGRHFLQVADAVVHFLGNGRGVGYDEAVEAPFFPKQVIHQILVHRRRNPLELIEGGHIARGTGVSRLLVRPHIAVQGLLAAQEHGIVVPAGLGAAVQRVVLDAHHHVVVVINPVRSLIASDIGLCQFSA